MNDQTTKSGKGFWVFCWRGTAMHMLAYMAAGLFASVAFDYRTWMQSDILSLIMRPFSSPLVALGPSLQAVPGFVLALILFRLREPLFEKRGGWLTLLLLVTGFSLFSPMALGVGSFEGLIYMKAPAIDHLIGLPETLLYSVAFSLGLYAWHRNPRRLWNVLALCGIALILAASLLGYLDAIGLLPARPA